MQKVKDIFHLYKAFDGEAETYLEIGRKREALQSKERWPLLSSLEDWTQIDCIVPVDAPRAVAPLQADTVLQTLATERADSIRTATVVFESSSEASAGEMTSKGFLSATVPLSRDASPLSMFARAGHDNAEEAHGTLDLKQFFAKLAEKQ